MATTLNSSGVQFPDGTTQTTAAGPVMTTIAAASLGAVGTYAWLWSTSSSNVGAGGTQAGSSLRYAGITVNNFGGNQNTITSGSLILTGNGGTPSGTWRSMGRAYGATGSSYDPTYYPMTLWLRIS